MTSEAPMSVWYISAAVPVVVDWQCIVSNNPEMANPPGFATAMDLSADERVLVADPLLAKMLSMFPFPLYPVASVLLHVSFHICE
jgi:hypothetical protein